MGCAGNSGSGNRQPATAVGVRVGVMRPLSIGALRARGVSTRHPFLRSKKWRTVQRNEVLENEEGQAIMSAYNVVRFRVKPGRDDEFIENHRAMAERPMKGFIDGAVIKTGDRSYCLIGEWDNFESIVAARPEMKDVLDTFRDTLEDLGSGLGMTDPVSGETVVNLTPKP